MPDWFPNISRALSLVIALVYLGLAIFSAPSAAKLFAGLLIFGGALVVAILEDKPLRKRPQLGARRMPPIITRERNKEDSFLN